MEHFEKDVYDIIKNIEFKESNENYGRFQRELKRDLTILTKMNKAKKL